MRHEEKGELEDVCREYGIPMVLFAMESDKSFVDAVNGINAGTVVDGEAGFVLA